MDVPIEVVKELCKTLIRNRYGTIAVAKHKGYEWELCKDPNDGLYIVRWDKQGYGVDYEIPEKIFIELDGVD